MAMLIPLTACWIHFIFAYRKDLSPYSSNTDKANV